MAGMRPVAIIFGSRIMRAADRMVIGRRVRGEAPVAARRWSGENGDLLPEDGGRHRHPKPKESRTAESENAKPIPVDYDAPPRLAGYSSRQGELDYR